MWYQLVCAITNHNPPFITYVSDGTRCTLKNATINELLEDLAEEHHVTCGCSIKVGSRVWTASLSFDEALDASSLENPSSEPLPLGTLLDVIPSSTSSPLVHILVSGEMSPSTDYLALYRSKAFFIHMYRNASVMTRIREEFRGSNPPPVLPPADLTNYDRMCSRDFQVRGLVFAQKTDALRAVLSQFASSQINILRRPKGFGKTTFLSMLDAFFDFNSPRAYFPFVPGNQDMSAAPYHAHKRLLVFSLDLAELNSDDELISEHADCERLMNRAAERFLLRYQEFFAQDEAVKAGTLIRSFMGVTELLSRHGLKLFVTIDNYTSPVIQLPRSYYDEAISLQIFHVVDELVRAGRVAYAMIVGEDVSHHLEWQRQMEPFIDLSDEPAFADTIGFTPDEVVALGEVLSADLLKELPPTSSEPPGTKCVYSAAYVASVARDLVETGRCGPPETYPYQVLFSPPPAAEPPTALPPAAPGIQSCDDCDGLELSNLPSVSAWSAQMPEGDRGTIEAAMLAESDWFDTYDLDELEWIIADSLI